MSRNTKVIAALSAGHFILDAYSGFLNPIMPFIAAKIGITMTFAAVLISISNITSSLSQPLFGFIADKIHHRFFIFWGLLSASIFLSFIGIADNVFTLIICILLGHIGVSFFHPQGTSLVSNYVNCASNSREMSIFIAMGTFGFSSGPAVSSGIAELWGLDKLPYACIAGIIAAFLLLKIVPKIKLECAPDKNISLIKAVGAMLKNKPVTILTAASIVKSFVVSSFSIILPFYWKEAGYSVSKIGLILFAFMSMGALAIILSPWFEKRIGVKNVFYISLISVFPLGIIFYSSEGMGAIGLISFILIGFFSFFAVPVTMSLAQRLMPEFKSMISGFIGGFSWGIIGVILPLITMLAEKTGIMIILLIMTLIPALFSYFIKYLPEQAEIK